MQPYGSDRMRLDGDRIILASRMNKGWTPRVVKDFTTAEFPGTAILWDDQYYEVVSADPLPPDGVRYVLEPWREQHAIRVTDRYDEDSESGRVAEYQKKLMREKQRKGVNALAILTGHLPAQVQQLLASELGVPAPRLTLVSIMGMYAVVAAIVLAAVSMMMRREGLPLVVVGIGVYLTLENTIRWHISWSQSRPMGSVFGWIAYALYYAITRKGPSPFEVEKGYSVTITDAPPDVAQQDALKMREGFFTLLPAADQARIAARWGYDYRRESRIVASIILVGSVIGVLSSRSSGAAVSMFMAALLAGEQVYRLVAFRHGPAGSILGILVRPFVRKYL